MSFQKCPKCNGEGVTISGLKCPVCLGEFVIHEEQGVPPSKVKEIYSISKHIEALEALVLEITTSGKMYTKEAVKQRMQFYRQMLDLSINESFDSEGFNCDHSKPKP